MKESLQEWKRVKGKKNFQGNLRATFRVGKKKKKKLVEASLSTIVLLFYH